MNQDNFKKKMTTKTNYNYTIQNTTTKTNWSAKWPAKKANQALRFAELIWVINFHLVGFETNPK